MGNPARLKLLRNLGVGHRYPRWRALTMAISFAVLVAIPALGIARLDLLGGRHVVWGRPVDGVTGLVWVAIVIAAFYVVTFVLNAALGRVFCGWGCPVGQGSRVADWVDSAAPGQRRARALGAAAYALALGGVVTCWWISPRALLTGVAPALLALGAWLALASAVWLHGRSWRWRFCTQVCPIGLYYSAVQTPHGFGIQFERSDGCIDCDACASVCPVGLDARDLSRRVSDLGGLALDEMPARNHCFTCGDCVRACELVLRKRRPPRLPLTLGRSRAKA